jgi:hypothetical protein
MKKTMTHRTSLVSILSGLILLTGCATEQKKPETPAPASVPAAKPEKPITPPKIPEQKAPVIPPPIVKTPLNEGIELYDKGDFNGAIKHLVGATEIWSGDKPTQVMALKYIAFSYCLTGRQVLCRQQFERAFKLDPSFDLAPGEKGHPLWEPSFERAKKAKR